MRVMRYDTLIDAVVALYFSYVIDTDRKLCIHYNDRIDLSLILLMIHRLGYQEHEYDIKNNYVVIKSE